MLYMDSVLQCSFCFCANSVNVQYDADLWVLFTLQSFFFPIFSGSPHGAFMFFSDLEHNSISTRPCSNLCHFPDFSEGNLGEGNESTITKCSNCQKHREDSEHLTWTTNHTPPALSGYVAFCKGAVYSKHSPWLCLVSL